MTILHLWIVREFSITVTYQPLFKNAVNHCVVSDEEWVVGRGCNIFNGAFHIVRQVGCEVSYTGYDVALSDRNKIRVTERDELASYVDN